MLHLDTGNTGFMLLCCSLVMLMTPGLGFFYGGLVGRKNVLAIMIQSFVSMGWTTVIWFVYGYSLCFSGDYRGIVGNLHNAFLRNMTLSTPSPNDTIPLIVFITYRDSVGECPTDERRSDDGEHHLRMEQAYITF